MRSRRQPWPALAGFFCWATLLASVALLPCTHGYARSGIDAEQLLGDSIDHLGRGEVQRACNEWTELLTEPWPYGAVALHHLELWHEACTMASGLPRTLSAILAVKGGDVTRWRAKELAWALWQKWGSGIGGTLPESVGPLNPKLSLTPQDEVIWSSPIPYTLCTLGVPTNDPEGTLVNGYPQESSVRRTTWYFYTPAEGQGMFGLSPNGPASAWLDGRPLGQRMSGRILSGTSGWLFSAGLRAGCHRLELVDAVGAVSAPLTLSAFLPLGAAAAQRCEPMAGWESTSKPSSCSASDWVCSLADLAELAQDNPDREALLHGILASGTPSLIMMLLRSSAELGPGSARLETSLAEATRGEYCSLDLLWARGHIRGGRDELAAEILEALPQTCSETAEAHLIRIELALEQGFYPLAVQLAEEAHAAFPLDCRITAEWARGLAERGQDYFSIQHLVTCPAVDSELRMAADQWGVDQEQPLPDSYVLPELVPGWIQRKFLEALSQASPEGAVRQLSRHHSNLFHQALALTLSQDLVRAKQVAQAIRSVPGAWSWERSVAGRLQAWGEALALTQDPFAAIRAFQVHGFAKSSPQVVVLDETVGMLDDHGWLTTVETVVLYLNSPTAVEGIGEVTLEGGRERMLAGVMKSDGTWRPAEPSQIGGGETLSFKGLAPGDFYVLRTVKEVAAEFSAGACHLVGRHSFGNRSMPLFLGRLVLRMQSPELWNLVTTPGVQVKWEQPKVAVVEVAQLPPIPLEPGAADKLDGLDTVEIQSKCLSWPALRDTAADRLLARCDAPIPAALRLSTADPFALVERVTELVEEDGSGWDTRDVSQIWSEGRGSVGLAAWCALMVAGHEAWPVMVNPSATGPLRLGLLGFRQLGGMAIRLVFQGEETFLAPGARGVDARILPSSWLGREALLLHPLDGRLTVRMPQTAPGDEQEATLRVVVDKSRRVTGELRLTVQGFGAWQMSQHMEELPEELAQSLTNYVRHFLGNAVPVSHSFKREGQRATLVVAFRLEAPVNGVLRIGLPPRPLSETTALATRTQPLAFAGLMPTKLDVRVTAKGGVTLSTEGRSETIQSRYGRLDITVEQDEDEVSVTKELSAKASRVEPADYRVFAEFMGSLHRRATLEVRLK